jgi:hypothetical protein
MQREHISIRSIFYNEGSKIQKDPKVMRGVMISIERMYPDQDTQDQINMQRDMYKESSGMFGFSSTQRLREKKMPGKIQFVNRYIVILLVFFFKFAIAKLVIFVFFYNSPLVDRLWL